MTSPGRRRIGRLVAFVRTRPRLLPFAPVIAHRSLPVPARPRWQPPQLGNRPHPTRLPATGLTVFSIIRNGITNGYPFIEAYGSWLTYCDRVLVVDGCSDDGTREALDLLASLHPQVEVVSRPWPAAGESGTAIAAFTEAALAEARSRGSERLAYVQADEIYSLRQRALVRDTQTALEFAGCVNFWNGLDTVLENTFPMRYLRSFPAGAEARSLGDGFSFAVDGAVSTDSEPFLHYGWCFPEQILRKHVSHGRLYHDEPDYRLRAWLAGRMLAQHRHDRRLLDALQPRYRPVPFHGEHPECMRHLLGRVSYDPAVGLRLLADGAVW